MEIDIPELNNCSLCKGTGIYKTGAGDELLRFLKEQGFEPSNRRVSL